MTRPRHTELAGQRARNLRNGLTISEARLWSALKSRGAGARFRRQVPIGRWIADFASLRPRLVIEVDDLSHEWKEEQERTAYLESVGFAVLRFDNEEVAKDLEAVVNTILLWVEHLRRTGKPPIESGSHTDG